MTAGACLAESQTLDWTPVTSSNLGQVAFSAASDGPEAAGRLYVEFKARPRRPATLWVYHAVPAAVYRGLLAAASKGAYLDRLVKKAGYDYARLY
jgi:hypothetical protein